MKSYFNNKKKILITVIMVFFLITTITVIYASYIDPFSLSDNPLPSIDTGLANQTKNSDLTIESNSGTATLSPSSILFKSGVGGMINIQNFENIGTFPAIQSGEFRTPIGFMWKGSDPLMSAYNLSLGTSSSFGELTITNGTASSTVMNIINIGSSSTIAVGAYYDTSSGLWKSLNTSLQPMAITFDPVSGIWFHAGAKQSDQNSNVIYWRASMHMDPVTRNVIFSNLFTGTSTYFYWEFIGAGASGSGEERDTSEYCATFYSPSDSSICGSANGPIKNPVKIIQPGKAGTPSFCQNNDTIYYSNLAQLGSTQPMFAIYQCRKGENDPSNNRSTLYVGNLFVQEQSFGSNNIIVAATTTVANPTLDDWWFKCPDGYYASGILQENLVWYLKCSKLK